MTTVVAPRYGNDQKSGVMVNKLLYPFWELMLLNNVGGKVKSVDYTDKTVQVYGTLSTGGSITLRGSNKENPDETVAADWFNLNDPTQTALTFTALGGKQVLENPMWLSPICSAGDGSTSLNMAVTAIKRT